MEAAMGTGATAVPIPLKRLLPLTPIAVGAHLWLAAECLSLGLFFRIVWDVCDQGRPLSYGGE